MELASNPDEEVVMNAIVANVLMREATNARTDAGPFRAVLVFCGVGLLASLGMVCYGFDLGAGFF
jgi:hypothetical protein